MRGVNNKKSQITLFIIIGVTLLLVAGTVLYIKRPVDVAELEESIEQVPSEIKPIQDFVTSCLNKNAREALILLGSHGGYIDMNDTEVSGKTFRLDPKEPTESDAAFLGMNPSLHVGYWWFLKSKNKCFNCFLSDENKPTLELMQEQVNRYLKNNINACFDGFKNFEKQGFYIMPQGEPKIRSSINEKDVSVFMNYPITIKIGERVTNITKFSSRLRLNLKGIYDFASSILDTEIDNQFLELIVKHLISISSGAEFGVLPPTYASESSFVPVRWSKQLVKLQLQELFTSYVPIIQLKGTRSASEIEFSDDTNIQNLYKPFFVESLKNPRPEYGVRFIYLRSPVYLEITPSEGDMLKPEIIPLTNKMGPFTVPYVFKPINNYAFFYDVSLPVIIEVKSYDEFFNETYTFLFAIEVNLRDNKDMKEWLNGKGTIGPWDYTLVGSRGNDKVKESLSMAKDVDKEVVEELASSPLTQGNFTKNLFCNERQRISGGVEIFVSNKTNGNPIEGVNIAYSCGEYESCRIGQTKIDDEKNKAVLDSRFPICLGGGIIRIEKEGFMSEVIGGISTLPDKNLSFDVKLEPLRKLNVSVKKFIIQRVVFNDSMANEIKLIFWDDMLLPIGNYDMVMISFKKINETPWEEMFSKFILIYGNDTKNIENFRTVDIVPGKYTVDIGYFYLNKTVIPKNCKHVCDQCKSHWCEKWCRMYPENYTDKCDPKYSAASVGAGGAACIKCGECEADVFAPEEDIVLEQQILGGFKMNESNPWVVKASEIDQKKTAEFYLVHAPLPRCLDDLSESQNASNFYEPMIQRLKPRLI